jgi:hypothetical protein
VSAQLVGALAKECAARFPLPWSHYVRLLAVRSAHARAFYESEALRGGWTIRQLDRQIQSQFYERTALSRDNERRKPSLFRMTSNGGRIEMRTVKATVSEWAGRRR